MFDLDEPEPRALVTGASSGLGAEFARRLARRGYNLVLVARREERLRELADEAGSGRDITIEVLPADLATEEGLETVLERLRTGDVTYVVNAAGFGIAGEFLDASLEANLAQLDVDARAVTAICYEALAAMKRRRQGTIINIASFNAFQPGPFMATYAASKAYVLSLSESLHEEAHSYGVTVTCLAPGPMKTEFLQVSGQAAEEWPDFLYEPVERVVTEALDAARLRRALVVPGVAQKLTMVGNRFVPRFASRRLAALFMQRVSTSSSQSH